MSGEQGKLTAVDVFDKRDSLTHEIWAWFAECGESDSDMCAVADELAERLMREGFISFD